LERTLVLIKPDATRRDNVWLDIIDMYRAAGLRIAQARLIPCMSEDMVRHHYHEHLDKPFFPEMLEYMMSGPVVALILEGEDAVQRVRRLNGATRNAEPGTIRARFSEGGFVNSVHGSDSPDSAEREIQMFFA